MDAAARRGRLRRFGDDRICCGGGCCPQGQCCVNGSCQPCGCEIDGVTYAPQTINPANPCRCARRVDYAVRIGRVEPDRLLFAAGPTLPPDERTREVIREMERLHSAADLLRGHPRYAAPETVLAAIRGLLDSANVRTVLD